jgi:peptide-methionine (S)-S-oxide reductase
VGYTGGYIPNPSYQEICSGNTGHVEAVKILYDPVIVSYEELLGVFWEIHDPTAVNRQSLNVGNQYRSVIFYATDAQKRAAVASKEWLQRWVYPNKAITTEILRETVFYSASEYHQHYYHKRKQQRLVSYTV